MIARRFVALLAAFAVAVPACAWLRDPFEPWQVDIIYDDVGGGAVARPQLVTVDAPFGFVVLTNNTTALRGFAIDATAIYETIRPDATVRIRIDELRDNRTYVFYDQLHPQEIRGTLRTRFVPEEER